MTIQEFKKQFNETQLNKLYIFTGEEYFLKNYWVQKISEKLNLTPERISSIEDVKKGSLLEPIHFYVLYTSTIKDLVANNNYIIIFCDTLDKRTTFYKKNKDKIVEFTKLTEEQLIQYIKRQINLNFENCKDLISRCNSDLGLIDLELHKFISYSNSFSNDDYNNIMDTFFDIIPDDVTFDLCNAILCKKDILIYYEKCMQINQSILGMLNALYLNLRQLLQIQMSGKDIEKETGLSYFIINKLKPNVNRYTNEELVKMLNIIFKLDIGIKTGKIPEEIAFKYLLCEIL